MRQLVKGDTSIFGLGVRAFDAAFEAGQIDREVLMQVPILASADHQRARSETPLPCRRAYKFRLCCVAGQPKAEQTRRGRDDTSLFGMRVKVFLEALDGGGAALSGPHGHLNSPMSTIRNACAVSLDIPVSPLPCRRATKTS